jgi:hypothetical protein
VRTSLSLNLPAVLGTLPQVCAYVTVLFVHGTGVRGEGYRSTLEQIQGGIYRAGLGDIKLVGCPWGDSVGSKRNAGGLSIPKYTERGGKGKPTDEEIQIELWRYLYSDPTYEFRVLSVTCPKAPGPRPGEKSAAETLEQLTRELSPATQLLAKLKEGQVDGFFEQGRKDILADPAFYRMLAVATDPLGQFQEAVARAIVARTITLGREDRYHDSLMGLDPQLRDETVRLLRSQLGPYQAAVQDWVFQLVAPMGTKLLNRRFGKIIDERSDLIADILFYQSNGDLIRTFIAEWIRTLTPPVVLLGHSLGGVASVEVLLKHEDLRKRIPLLITVGSQAPYFYEINSLKTLPFGHKLPGDFPPWTNLFDPKDFLSFVGDFENLFRGRIVDRQVDNRQPFPESHGAYWSNPETYREISDSLLRNVSTNLQR